MAPFLLCALGIPESLDANTLYGYLKEILDGLWAVGANVISYTCDGTETERSVQRSIAENASSTLEYTIQHPSRAADHTIVIPVHGTSPPRPIPPIQDFGHARKTFRNNGFSGGRFIILGNYTVLFRRFNQVAFEHNSPLYHRDANEKLDRQDDAAAARLFSAELLQYITLHHPGWCGEIVYLFVFGELVDAWDNRYITHLGRVTMVLRARYFLDLMETYLTHAGYKLCTYFISLESLDVARYLIDGHLSRLRT